MTCTFTAFGQTDATYKNSQNYKDVSILILIYGISLIINDGIHLKNEGSVFGTNASIKNL